MTINDIKAYFEFRGQTWPDGKSAIDFASTELGEVIDAWLRQQPQWKRNNQKETNIGHELADLYMMIQIASHELTGKSLQENLADKWKSKGYTIPTPTQLEKMWDDEE